MHLTPKTALLALAPAALASHIGYDCHPYCIASTVSANETVCFGAHYAVLNLDLINGIVGSVANTSAGDAFIHNTATWIDAVHQITPAPLTIFTRIFFSNARQPEISDSTPFKKVGGALGTADDPKTELYPAFKADEGRGDVVLAKTRYYAGAGNALEEILSSQGIDTVVLSGIRSSGVIMSTAYRLFDLNYKVYVIANNTIEGDDEVGINRAILEGMIPKLPADVITIEQAMEGLKNSPPAVY